MSRYEWPAPGGLVSQDRALRRAAWRERLLGAVPPELIQSAAEERIVQERAAGERAARGGRPRLAPGPDTDLWLPIGPTSVVRGQAGSRPRIAGRVRDLRVSPDGGRAYAATANGGVWFSGDAGSTWHPLGGWATTTGAAQLARPANILVCGALHVDFGAAADGSADTVHVATGELRPRSSGTPGAQIGGIGVLHLNVSVPAALADPFANPWRREANNLTGIGIFRIARDPASANRLVAATSAGLFARDGAFVENADWQRITVSPFDFDADDRMWTSDVVWAPAQAPVPSRLWVALVDGSDTGIFDPDRTAVYVSENGIAGPFQKVELPQSVHGRRLGIAVAPSDPAVVYVLGGPPPRNMVSELGAGPRLWRIDGTTARRVDDVPEHLFGKTNDQSSYDLAVEVHPTASNMVVLGGSTVYADGNWSASLFRCTVACTAAGCSAGFVAANNATPALDPTFIGSDVHADVHALRWVPAAGSPQLWVGCDGGVYRSLANGDRHTFTARNNGLAVVEPGFVACHPTSDGMVLAGTQDNGTIRRIGGGLWDVVLQGDGGGTVFHPTSPHAYVSQYTNAHWNSNATFAKPVMRLTTDTHKEESETDENGAASFYSGAAVFASTEGNARLVLGTNRVWLTETWNPGAPVADMSWVTLPSNRDPREDGNADITTDTFEGYRGQVISCRWVDVNRILALCVRAIMLMERDPVTGDWQRHVLSSHSVKCGTFDNDDVTQPTAEFMPPLGAWSDIAVHDPARGTRGSFYVSATGHVTFDDDDVVESERMDTLWWFDGTDTWHPTGLRNDAAGGKAPAYAVVCDPDDAGTVYVGTAIGVYRGVLDLSGAAPAWTWEYFANGLPEASVQDLAFYNAFGIKLLRAAVQARGVWEVDLSGAPTPPGRTYLRAHPYDTRRISPTPLTDPTKSGGVLYPWNRSPDLIVRPAPGGPAVTRPTTLPWVGAAPDSYDLWTLQTALHASDPLCRTTGTWTPNFAERLKAFRGANGMPATARVDAATWDAIVAAGPPFSDPWGADEPTEADLCELIHDYRGTGAHGEYVLTGVAPYRVHVLVHHSHSRPVAAANVNVLLLTRPLAAAERPDAGGAVALTPAWKTAIVDRLGGATPAIPDGWIAVGAIGHPAGDVDARIARVVTFELDLTGAAAGSQHLLLALVSSTADPVSAATLPGGTVRELVLGSRHAAARTMWV